MSVTAVEKGEPQVGGDDVGDAMLQLLGHRYGDGLVYLREDEERGLLDRAIRLGFVSQDGYITPEGQSVLARQQD